LHDDPLTTIIYYRRALSHVWAAPRLGAN